MRKVKISNAQKKKIVADYIMLKSYAAVAKKYDISASYTRKIVLANQTLADELANCKEKLDLDIHAYLEGKYSDFKVFTDLYFKKLTDEKFVKKTNLRDLTGAFSTIFDRYVKLGDRNDSDRNEGTGVVLLPAIIKKEE